MNHILDSFGVAAKYALLAAACLLLAACDLRREVRCGVTDIPTDLKSGDARKRGDAADCARSLAPEQAASMVPALLQLLTDRTVYGKVYHGGGIIGFGEAGERELIVGMAAAYAIRQAKPTEANIAPMVAKLIQSANQMPKAEYSGLWGEPSTAVGEIIQLFENEFVKTGLRDQVATTLAPRAGEITNANVWAWPDFVKQLSGATQGKSPLVEAQVVRLASIAANAAAIANAPAPLPPLRELRQGAPSIAETPRTTRRGMTWSLQGAQTVEGWAAVGCHGEPKEPMIETHSGGCNPYQGDTVCSAVLPILCVRKAEANAPAPSREERARLDGAIDARVALTKALSGTRLSTRDAGTAICISELGADWRMAQHHDGNSWRFAARAQNRGAFSGKRFWVAINDQQGNCWSK
jgi:hypothetical protein